MLRSLGARTWATTCCEVTAKGSVERLVLSTVMAGA